MFESLECLKHLVTCGDLIGEALVPYYRQLLPIMNIFVTQTPNTGDQIDYGKCGCGYWCLLLLWRSVAVAIFVAVGIAMRDLEQLLILTDDDGH